MSQRIKLFLTVSLILNILFIAIIFGEASFSLSRYFTQPTLTISSSSECCIPTLEAQLPEAKRKLLEDNMRPALEKMQAIHTKIDQEKKEALALIKAEHFDANAYLRKIQAIESLHAQMKEDMAKVVTRIASGFTPQERIVLADIISHISTTTTAKPHG